MQTAAAAQACLESLRRSQWQVTAGLTPDQHTLTHGCSDVEAAALTAAAAAAVAAVTAATDTAALEVGPAAAAVVAVAAAAASLAVAAGPAVDPAAVAVAAAAFGPSLQTVKAFAADMTPTGAVASAGSGLVEGQAMQLALPAAVAAVTAAVVEAGWRS